MDLRRACLDCLEQYREDLEDAVIYLDAGAGEALHFVGGIGALLPFAPRALCSLEHASPLDGAIPLSIQTKGPLHKFLVITSRLLSDAHRFILRCLLMHNSVNRCTILTAISEEAHSIHPDTPLGSDAFHEYGILLLQDYQPLATSKHCLVEDGDGHSELGDAIIKGGDDLTGEAEVLPETPERVDIEKKEGRGFSDGPTIVVKHLPMLICPLTSNLFLFPSGAVAEACLSNKGEGSLGPGLPSVDTGAIADADEHAPIGAPLLAHFLHHFSKQLDLKFEIFTLGPFGQLVGKALTDISIISDISGRSRQSAGLLLIDRTLDLITPACHGDSVLDKLFSSQSRKTCRNERSRSTYVTRPRLDVRLTPQQSASIGEGIIDIPQQWKRSLVNAFIKVHGLRKKVEASYAEEDSNRFSLLTDGYGGSVFDCNESKDKECLDLLLDKKTKEATLLVRKWLHEAIHRENLTLPSRRGRLGGVISVEEIRSLRKLLTENSDCAFRYAHLLNLAILVEEVMDSNFSSRWEAFASAERILMLSTEDSSQNMACQIRDLVQQSSHRPSVNGLLSLKDALSLALVGYGLAGESFGKVASGGPFSWEDEQELKETIVSTLFDRPPEQELGFLSDLVDSIEAYQSKQEKCGSYDEKIEPKAIKDDVDQIDFGDEWGSWEEPEEEPNLDSTELVEEYGGHQLKLELRDRVEDVFKKLHLVAGATKRISIKERTLLAAEESSGFGSFSSSRRSLLFKLLSLIFTKAEIPGLEHHSSSVGRFFKSGFGRFGIGQMKPKLCDHKILVVFIIGGINGIEVREVREAQSLFSGAEEVDILLGGTTFLTPSDVYDLIMGSIRS